MGEETKGAKRKKKKKKKGRGAAVEDADANEDEEAAKRPVSQPPKTEEDMVEVVEGVGKLSFETEREYWWAQADHIQGLTQEAKVARAKKKQAEDIEVNNMRESFLVAEAMGVSGIEGANPYRPDSEPQAEERGESSQMAELIKFLEESIMQKESNLECPVCLEVIFIFQRYYFGNFLPTGGK